MSKQDRQGVRRPADLEQKYNFGRVFSDQKKTNARQESELNRQSMTTSEFISYASSAIDKLTKELEKANETIADLQSADTAFEGRISAAEGSISDHGTRLDSAEGSISQQNNRLSAAEGNISNQESKLNAAESDISSLKERVTALETTT